MTVGAATTVHAATLTAPRRIAYGPTAPLAPGPGELLVEVAATGICGSDLAAWRGTHPYKTAPCVLGHEFSGTVARLGDGVTGFAEGDLVCSAAFSHCDDCAPCRRGDANLCTRKRNLSHLGWDGSFADHVLLRPNMTHRLPSDLHPVAGALVEPLTIGHHAMRLAGDGRGRSAVVLGSGTIGLSTLLSARRLDYGPVACVDVGARKGALARSMGADAYVDAEDGDVVARAVRAVGGPADVVVVAAGYPGVVDQAGAAVRPGGEVVVVSYFPGAVPVELNSLVGREVTVRCSALSTPRDFTEVIGWLADGSLDPLPMVTHHFPLAEADAALRLMDRADVPTGKIMIHVSTDAGEFDTTWAR